MNTETVTKPHMTDNEFKLFQKYINRAKNILEFGSGGSTEYYFSQQEIPNVISIESSAEFIQEMRKKPVINNAIKSKKLCYIHGNIGITKKWGMPTDKNTSGENYWGEPLKYIVSTPLFDEVIFSPDIILIDGRYRVACILNCILSFSDFNYIIAHDYENRPHYHAVEQFLDKIEFADSLAVFKLKENINHDEVLELLVKYKNIYD